MGWQYVSSVLHGITIHEMACVAYYLLTIGVTQPKQLKQALFRTSAFCAICGIIGFGGLTAILNWRMDVAASPQPLAQMNAWFIPIATWSSMCTLVFLYGLTVVILIRTMKVYQVL